MNKTKTSTIYRCSKCNSQIDQLELYPNNLCFKCYSLIMDKIPLDKLPQPDFIKSINK